MALTFATPARTSPPPAAIWTRAGVFVVDTRSFPNAAALADELSSNGFAWAAFKIHDRLTALPLDRSWIDTFRAHGIAVGGWGVEGTHPRLEARLGAELVERYGLDFYIANAEAPYKVDTGGRWGRSALFTRAFREREPSLPAALATYGASTCRCVLPIDFAAWRRAHFALLPEAYYNQFHAYRPDRTVAHALRAGWRRSDVHPIIGVYHHYPAGRYVPLLARARTLGFSVFLAEAARPSDYTSLAPRIEAEARRLPTFSSPAGPAGAPVAVAPPALAGRAIAGRVLTVAPGAWTGERPMAAAYEWQRCAAGACFSVVGEKKPVYALGADDAGFTIRVVVKQANARGAATAYSIPSGAVAVRGTSQPAP